MSRRIVIGVAGGSASGKTSVAARLMDTLDPGEVALLKQDSYYRDLSGMKKEVRERQNFDHPDAFDTDLLVGHLESLLRGESVDEPVYDFTLHQPSALTRKIQAGRVIVVEGILVLAEPRLRDLMDIKLFVDADSDVRLVRRVRRDVEERGRTVDSVLGQYESSVRPMHLQFIEPSKRYADVIIPEGGHNHVAIDLIRTKIASILREAPGRRAADTNA